MHEIEIKIIHPIRILLIIGGTVALVFWAGSFVETDQTRASATGGPEVQDAEEQIYRQRIEQAVLDRREEILRYQLRVLEEEKIRFDRTWTEEQQQAWQQSRDQLLEVLSDRRKSEAIIRTALRELWEAQGRALASSLDLSRPLHLSWPVEPTEGLSANFLDEAYENRFGIPHEAIDIPVLQGTEVRSAAEGVVESIYEGESGYNYVILSHPGGATLYGHVEKFLVREGQYVHRGDPIALSGGMPGTPGAGPISTGPHVHFEVMRGGAHVDPLLHLTAISSLAN